MTRLFCILLLSTSFLYTAASAEVSSATPSKSEQTVIDYIGTGEPTVLRLWPDGSERNKSRNGKAEVANLTNNLRVTNVENPSLFVYPPPAGSPNTGASVLFCPGGGYGILAMANPKEFIAWANHLGITVAVLKYHVPRTKKDPNHLWPLSDAQRALRVLRANAEAFKLDPNKIGLVGTSAGGHLGLNACINHEHAAYDAIDDTDKLSCRPAFGILFYPAYVTKGKSDLAVSPALHTDRIDAKKTPPILVTVNADDGFNLGSLRTLMELKNKKVPGELHMWSSGGHGGVFKKYPLVEFARPGIRFLARHGILEETLLSKSDDWLNAKVAELQSGKTSGTKAASKKGTPAKGLADDQLSLIDRDVRKRIGAKPTVYQLWPGTGTRADDPLKNVEENLKQRNVPVASNVTSPTMTFFPADKPDGRCVIVFPGGGYGVLAFEHEGLDVAKWLNSQGIHAFLLKYRTPRRKNLDKHHVAFQDASRAIRLVRSQAADFGIRPDAIGVLGFSAGGHLAALASTPSATPSYDAIDKHDKVSPTADFGILIYPAYTADKDGKVDPALQPKTKPKSPLFIATALDDRFTQEQFYFVHDRLKLKQPIEYHIYENGGHGKGMLPSGLAFAQWPRECARWLKDQAAK